MGLCGGAFAGMLAAAMRVPISRLVVAEVPYPFEAKRRVGGELELLHVLGDRKALSPLCMGGQGPGQSKTARLWRRATQADTGLGLCPVCRAAEESTQAHERKVLRAMGRVGFR